MSETIQGVVVIAIYRVSTILVGCGIIYMGYRLFTSGLFERAGELKAAWGDKNLALRQAAPGSFFALFGATVIVVSLMKGLDVQQGEQSLDGTRMSGMGGSTGQTEPLSAQLRRELTSYAICAASAFADTGVARCREGLTDHLTRVPLASDFVLIDSLEERNDKPAGDQLDALRRQFIK